MPETYGQALARAWREGECAGEPTAEESYAACLHSDACGRLAAMHDGHDREPACDWCGCDACCEWEGGDGGGAVVAARDEGRRPGGIQMRNRGIDAASHALVGVRHGSE